MFIALKNRCTEAINGQGVAKWTDRRLNDLQPVPARVAALEATVDHLTVELESAPADLAVLAAAVDRLAEENRMLRAELATTQRYLLQTSCAFLAALLGAAGAIIAALL
jgi:hypothetical protein